MSESGKIVRNVVEYIISQIVEDQKSVKVDISSSDDENVAIEVRTSPNDMGRVIGKRCLLYTSPSPRDSFRSRMPSSA